MKFVTNTIELIESLVATAIVQSILILILSVYIYRNRKKTYNLYRSIIHQIRKFRVSQRKAHRNRIPEFDDAATYHMAEFDISEMSTNPFTNTPLISTEKKIRFCKNKFRSIKKRLEEYYMFTNGRIKPLDLYELCIYKREMERLESDSSKKNTRTRAKRK